MHDTFMLKEYSLEWEPATSPKSALAYRGRNVLEDIFQENLKEKRMLFFNPKWKFEYE